VPARRPSPAALLVALVVALLAPVGVVMATGLSDGGSGHDGEVETAGNADDGGRHDVADPDASITVGDGPSMTGASPTAAAPATAPDTTAAPAPATTASPTTTSPPPPPPPTTAAPPPPSTAPPPTAPPPPPSAVDQVVALANNARAQAGCGPLRVDARITAAAQAHSDDMAANHYFSHDSLDGRSFADRLRAAGYPSPGGENIAQGQRTAQSVHNAWMNSSGHRANILNCGFTAIGMGVNQSAWTWTQDFGY
jgi:uncharacterized protein YkwD